MTTIDDLQAVFASDETKQRDALVGAQYGLARLKGGHCRDPLGNRITLSEGDGKLFAAILAEIGEVLS